jgi:tyrosine-protein kinase Etk/Wzc
VEEKEVRQPQEKDRINLLDYLIIIARRKRIVIGITMGMAVITAIISLVMPPVFMAETKILPPQQSSGMRSQLMELSQLGAAIGIGGGGLRNPADMYIGMLKSRPVLDRIIERFDLMNLYHKQYYQDARMTVLKKLVVKYDKKSTIITLNVNDKNPQLAADMANAFVEELKALNKGLAVSEAAQRRLFFEEQLKDTKEALMKSEEEMKTFQEKTGAIKMDAQAHSIISGISQARAQIAAKEVQIRVMRTYSTPQNPDVQRAVEELKGLQAQLAQLESRNGGNSSVSSTGGVTSAGIEYVRKMRDVKFNEILYNLLLKQYEAAKLDEARDATVIQIIEKAVPPEKRIKPKRRNMVIIAIFLGFFVSIGVVFFIEYREKVRREDPETMEKFETLRKLLSFNLKLRERFRRKQ